MGISQAALGGCRMKVTSSPGLQSPFAATLRRIHDASLPGMSREALLNLNLSFNANPRYNVFFKASRPGFEIGKPELDRLTFAWTLVPKYFTQPLELVQDNEGRILGIRMEKVRGITLAEAILRGKLRGDEARDLREARFMLKIHGIAHGDIHMWNIMQGEVGLKLVDADTIEAAPGSMSLDLKEMGDIARMVQDLISDEEKKSLFMLMRGAVKMAFDQLPDIRPDLRHVRVAEEALQRLRSLQQDDRAMWDRMLRGFIVDGKYSKYFFTRVVELCVVGEVERRRLPWYYLSPDAVEERVYGALNRAAHYRSDLVKVARKMAKPPLGD